MKSAYLHLLTDMMASVAVLVGGLLMKFFGWFWVDSLMTIIIAVYLIVVGLKLLVESTKMLMLFTPDFIDIKELVREVHKIKGVKNYITYMFGILMTKNYTSKLTWIVLKISE